MTYFYSLPSYLKWLWISLVWWSFGIITLSFMPLRMGDGLHYLTVAWEMYKNHIYLSTYLGEILDLEKTPLLYWPIITGWHIFGVSDAWPFIFMYFLGWINLILTGWFAKQLFPESSQTSWLAIIVLMSSLYWPTFYDDIRFEGLTILFGLIFLNLAYKTLTEKNLYYWIIAGIAFGLCIFNKGPVALIYYLPLTILFPYWQKPLEKKIFWYSKLTLTLSLGMLIPLAWLIITYFQHDYATVKYLLFGQITKRVGLDFSFSQFISFFKNMLPWSLILVFFLINKPRAQWINRKTLAFCIFIFLEIMFFSIAVQWKIPRYLVPIYPIAAILMAHIIQQRFSMDYCLWVGGLFLIGLLIYDLTWQRSLRKSVSLEPAAQKIKLLENNNELIVQFGTGVGYQNFGFLGRLNRPLPIISPEIQKEWLATHPNAWIITTSKNLSPEMSSYEHWPIKKNEFLVLIPGKDYLEDKRKHA